MKIIRTEQKQLAQCIETAQKIIASSVGGSLSEKGAKSVAEWLNEHASDFTWFMESEGKGIAAYDEANTRLVLIGVLPQERRKGIGTALLDAVRDAADAANASRINVNASGDAIAFYKDYGFDILADTEEADGLAYAPAEYLLGRKHLGKTVKVFVDRPFGSLHPHIADLEYELNFGYVDMNLEGDGDMQDAWVYGVYEPVNSFTGSVIAIIYHKDGSSRLVVAPIGMAFKKEDVIAAVGFEEQYYDTRFIWASSIH